MAGFYVIRQTETRIPGGGENDPVFFEAYASEADFINALIDYYEELIAELDENTNYFEDDSGIEALQATKQHIEKLRKHQSADSATILKPEDYGFHELWWYWINVYVATNSLEEYAKFLYDKLYESSTDFEDDLNDYLEAYPVFEYLHQVFAHNKPFDKNYFLSHYSDFDNHWPEYLEFSFT